MVRAEQDLLDEMRDLYRRWKDDYRYTANRFLQKLNRDGAVKAATELILKPGRSKGFMELQSRGLLSLTVEALILKYEFRSLFTLEVAAAASRRLREARYSK